MEGDWVKLMAVIRMEHFNPLPPHGGRLLCAFFSTANGAFQSTPSAWRETETAHVHQFCDDISIHSLRMEGDTRGKHFFFRNSISIHSLRMEGDGEEKPVETPTEDISIHSLRMEGDVDLSETTDLTCAFQSTPSAWRETLRKAFILTGEKHFNPLPPHGGRPPEFSP